MVGDIVGYGGNPGECSEKLKEIKAVGIRGNHDHVVINESDPYIGLFNVNAKKTVLWTRENLTVDQKAYLVSMPVMDYGENGLNFQMIHGSPCNPFDYIESEGEAAIAIKAQAAMLCFVGHTHIPGIFLRG